jgi:hypothetical protein
MKLITSRIILACVLGAQVLTNAAEPGLRLDSPYQPGAHRHKVQLHAHSTDSNGDHAPDWVLRAYQELGYVAVAITDHDHSPSFTPRVTDPGGHGITHVPGVEYSGDDDLRSFSHMLGINIRSIHHADGVGNRPAQIGQALLEGGFAYLCHPYDLSIHRRGWSGEQITGWVRNFTGIEIHNGASYHDPDGRDYPYKVDLALLAGMEIQVIATDDFHRNAEQTMDRGCVFIFSDKPADAIGLPDIVQALRTGNFFAAGRLNTRHPQPPQFTGITVAGSRITVSTDQPVDIQFITARHNYFRGAPYCSQVNRGVTTAHYTASAADQWVRIKATRTDAAGNRSYAWSNPVFVRSAGAER